MNFFFGTFLDGKNFRAVVILRSKSNPSKKLSIP